MTDNEARMSVVLGNCSLEVSGSEDFVREQVQWFSTLVPTRPDLQLAPAPTQESGAVEPAAAPAAVDPTVQTSVPQDIATLFERSSPKTAAEKVLVVSYWLQEVSHESVVAARVNKELGHLGHPVDRISDVFIKLRDQAPALVLQTRKSGKAKQARKTYLVTGEGIKTVKGMLTGYSSTQE